MALERLTKSDHCRDYSNKYVVSAITAYLVTSTGLLQPVIPSELLDNLNVKHSIIFGIFYMANKNVTLAILLSVGYLTAIRVVDNIMEKGDLEIEELEVNPRRRYDRREI